MSATASRREVAVAKLPDRGGSSEAPSLRGKNSYQPPTSARRRWTRRGHGPLEVTPSRMGFSRMTAATAGSVAAATRTGTGSASVTSVRAAVVRTVRSVDAAGSDVAARWRSREPSRSSSSTSTPAGILMSARCSQVSQGLPQPSTVNVQSPTASGRTRPDQVSKPVPSSRRRTLWAIVPSGRCRTAVTPMLSWPSRNAVARTGTASPTAAVAGRRPPTLTGDTSVTGKRPASSGGGVRSSGRHVSSDDADEDAGASDGVGGAGAAFGAGAGVLVGVLRAGVLPMRGSLSARWGRGGCIKVTDEQELALHERSRQLHARMAPPTCAG